jgi:hypothetical protein
MSVEETGRGGTPRDKWIGVYIGILAVILAVVTTGGGNAAKEATLRNLEASNLWSFFQAKNMRRTSFVLAAEELELSLSTNPGWPPEIRSVVEAKAKAYRDQVARLTSEKATNEGLDELFVRAKAVEAARDIALRKDPYFDYAQAMLQISIVLASVAIVSGGNLLLVPSFLIGALGVALGLNGFLLAVPIPFIDG